MGEMESVKAAKQKERERGDQLNDLFGSVMGNSAAMNMMNSNPMNDLMSGGNGGSMGGNSGGGGGDDLLFGASADALMQNSENIGFRGELLNHTHTKGLQIEYEFVREQSRHGVKYNQIRLSFTNKWDKSMKGISLNPHNLDKSQQDWHNLSGGGVSELTPGQTYSDLIHVRFGKTSEMRFDIDVAEGTNKKRYTAKIKGIPGELMRPNVSYSVDVFLKKKASTGAMNERNVKCDIETLDEAANRILTAFNVGIVNSGADKNQFDMNKQRYFAGYLLADDSDVLIALEVKGNGKVMCTLHCTEFMLIDAITGVARQCLSNK